MTNINCQEEKIFTTKAERKEVGAYCHTPSLKNHPAGNTGTPPREGN